MEPIFILTQGGNNYALETSIKGFEIQRVEPPRTQGGHPYYTSEIFEGDTLSLRRGEPLRLLEGQKEVFLGLIVTDVVPTPW